MILIHENNITMDVIVDPYTVHHCDRLSCISLSPQERSSFAEYTAKAVAAALADQYATISVPAMAQLPDLILGELSALEEHLVATISDGDAGVDVSHLAFGASLPTWCFDAHNLIIRRIGAQIAARERLT